MAKYVRSSRAQEVLAEIWHFISLDNEDAATRVIKAAYETFELLARNPELGSVRASFRSLRAFPISGFRNYLILYRVAKESIEIVRVLHGARNLKRIFGE